MILHREGTCHRLAEGEDKKKVDGVSVSRVASAIEDTSSWLHETKGFPQTGKAETLVFKVLMSAIESYLVI